MKLELVDLEGTIKGTIEVPMEELKAALASPELSEEAKAALASPESSDDAAQLKESQGKVAELQEKLARAESRTMDDFPRVEKATFVLTWAKDLSPVNKAVFAKAVGISIAPAAEVAEADPAIIEGKTDKPGYKYLDHINLSVKE